MAENPNEIDLDLWLDQQIILRQNRLKTKFWEILTEVGKSANSEDLKKIHAKNLGIKLSKGNDLKGFPYQVLDLVRDFDLNNGFNIRVLNWFGHGLFIFVLIGKNHPKAPLTELTQHNWELDLSSTPWEYPDTLFGDKSTNKPTQKELEKSRFYQWHKPIPLSGEIGFVQSSILAELKKLIFLLS